MKDNQPGLLEAARAAFNPDAVPDAFETSSQSTECRSGVVWTYRVRACPAIPEYAALEGLAQFVRLERERFTKRSKQTVTTVSYWVTSQSSGVADARALGLACKGRWGIENRVFWVLDAVLGEDAARVRKGSAPGVMSCLRSMALNVLRRLGVRGVTVALERHAARPEVLLERLVSA